MNKSKTITINEKEVTIKKMAIGQTAKLMLAIENLPALVLNNFSLDEAQKMTIDSLLVKLPHIVANFQDDFLKVLEVASGIKKTEMEKEYGYEELVDVLTAVLEVNNFTAVFNKLKNLKQVLQNK
jgi:hypothetical protein